MSIKMHKSLVIIALCLWFVLGVAVMTRRDSITLSNISEAAHYVANRVHPARNIDDVVKKYGPGLQKTYFAKAGVSFPPSKLALIVLKDEKKLELWALNGSGGWKYIKT